MKILPNKEDIRLMDLTLIFLHQTGCTNVVTEFITKNKISIGTYSRIHDLVKEYSVELNIGTITSSGLSLTYKSEKFINKGGFATYFKELITEQEEDKYIKKLENNKLKNEAKLSNWQVKYYWVFFVIAIVGGLCGIISLIISILNR